MSKLMWILGILLTVAGLVLGLMIFASPVSVVQWGGGITLEVAAVLLVGGILAIGIGGIVNAIAGMPAPKVEIPAFVPPSAEQPAAIPEFAHRPAEPAAAAAARAGDDVSEPVKETIAALEEARQKIEQAFEPPQAHEAASAPPPAAAEPPPAAPEPAAAPEPEAAAEAEAPAEEEEVVLEEGQLYVVEERFIRQRPARILSDGTVEAETDEGWMRFENLEHLDEYLDAMAPAAKS
jgi:hypothetical protein